MSLDAEFQIHQQLMVQFEAAQAAAKEARAKVTRAFYQCAQGIGSGPDEHALVEAEYLEEEAAKLWQTVMNHLRETFAGTAG